MAKGYQNIWITYAFIAVGLIPIGMAISAVWNWNLARSWIPTQATVVAMNLTMRPATSHSGSNSHAFLSAEYEYHWNDAVIRAKAISPFASTELIRDHTLKIAEELRTARSREETVTCYVNANSPDQAYLKREFRYQGVLVASLIGILLSGGGVLIVRQHLKQTRKSIQPEASKPSDARESLATIELR